MNVTKNMGAGMVSSSGSISDLHRVTQRKKNPVNIVIQLYTWRDQLESTTTFMK
jgi:ABC-type molybdate transport system substrate-binding protein